MAIKSLIGNNREAIIAKDFGGHEYDNNVVFLGPDLTVFPFTF